MNPTIKRYLKALGPGILFASTCIGVSHLVQSTRAGAVYGFTLLTAILVANIFKYPFFEFAARYTSATGINILDGYYKKGKWILIVYLIITIPSMFIVTSAVTFVTAGLLENLLGFQLSTDIWSLLILIFCIIVLASGKYSTLDNLLKLIGAILLVSTITAFISAMVHGRVDTAPSFVPADVLEPAGIIFVIALMGWMPTAVDISTWTSLWAEAKMKQSGHKPTLKEALFDFNFGYWVTAFLAVCFLTLGSLIIYGTNTELSNSSPTFAHQVITMFTTAIGDWSYLVIAVAAFSTMFGTTITVVDGYGRAFTRTIELLSGSEARTKRMYILWTVVISIGAFFVISQYLNNLKSLVDLATILSFVIAPLAGYINYVVIFSKDIQQEFVPPKWLKYLAIAGLIFLSVFTVIYFVTLVNPDAATALFRAIF